MRYISASNDLSLVRKNGDIAHRFVLGELIIGDPASSAAGHVIVPGDGSLTTHIQQLFTSAGYVNAKIDPLFATPVEGSVTDLQRVGLGAIFFEAPPITTFNLTNLVIGNPYTVATGALTVTVSGVSTVYSAGQEYLSVAGATFSAVAGTVVYRSLPMNARARLVPAQHLQEAFRLKTLGNGQEATYSPTALGSFAPGVGFGSLLTLSI